MANSYVEYTTTGSGANGLGQTTFTAPTQFLSINDIRVKGYNGSSWTELTINEPRGTTTVTLSAAPSAYSKIRVFRSSTTEALIDFQNGSRLAESDLDTAYRQSLFVAQEVAEDADPEGGSGIGNIANSQLAGGITNDKLAGGITTNKLQLPLTNFSSTGIDDNATSTAMSIDSSGNIGIGTSSPDQPLDIAYTNNNAYSVDNFTNSENSGLRIENTSTTANAFSNLTFRVGSGADLFFGIEQKSANDGDFIFANQNSPDIEMMRIDTNGKVMLGSSTADGFLHIKNNFQSDIGMSMNDTSGSGGTAIRFKINGTTHGSIAYSGSGTSFNTSSDYRLKENVDYTFDATSRVKQLKPCRFNFIADGTDKVVDGFLAHEVQEIVPEAISGEKDAVDAEGNPDYQGIDQSKLVPLLVKTIQELEARITALETA